MHTEFNYVVFLIELPLVEKEVFQCAFLFYPSQGAKNTHFIALC